MKFKLIIILLACLAGFRLYGQTRIIPGEPQANPILLRGGIAHIGNGEVINNSVIGFDNGKINLIEDVSDDHLDVSDYEVIDITGMHVYPGLILINSLLGLEEISSLGDTEDHAERGSINPNVRTIIAYNTDSELIPTYRFNGILMAQITPTSGLVSGTSSIVQLDAWNWEDAVYVEDDALHISWPSRQLPPRWWEGETKWRENENYKDHVQEMENLFTEALAYTKLMNPKAPNLKLEALEGLFDGSQALHIHTNHEKTIIESIKFAQDHKVQKIVLVGGMGSYNVREFLNENDIPVVLPPVHDHPREPEGDYDEPYTLPARLTESGIKVALSHSGMIARGRNLAFYAGTAAAFGLTREEALQTITLNPAEILGIADQVGSLETGKDATLFVSEGDILDMRTNNLTHAFISGRQIQLEGRQEWLFRKYSDKYGHQIED